MQSFSVEDEACYLHVFKYREFDHDVHMSYYLARNMLSNKFGLKNQNCFFRLSL